MVRKKTVIARVLVARALQVLDPLPLLPATSTQHEGYKLAAYTADKLPKGWMKWAVQLCEANVRPLYEASTWGWNTEKKRQQLSHASACFLVAVPSSASSTGLETPAAYVNYRFEVDNDDAVAYCYEVHVEPSARKCGLASWLMMCLEQMAGQQGMSKVVLTVFADNMPARRLYARLGYSTDVTCPSAADAAQDPACRGYEILSKPVTAMV